MLAPAYVRPPDKRLPAGKDFGVSAGTVTTCKARFFGESLSRSVQTLRINLCLISAGTTRLAVSHVADASRGILAFLHGGVHPG